MFEALDCLSPFCTVLSQKAGLKLLDALTETTLQQRIREMGVDLWGSTSFSLAAN